MVLETPIVNQNRDVLRVQVFEYINGRLKGGDGILVATRDPTRLIQGVKAVSSWDPGAPDESPTSSLNVCGVWDSDKARGVSTQVVLLDMTDEWPSVVLDDWVRKVVAPMVMAREKMEVACANTGRKKANAVLSRID